MALDHVEALVYLLECLGFVINKEKLVEFLGLIGDSVNMELRFLLQNMNDSGGVSKIAEERFYLGSHPGHLFGKKNAIACVIPPAPLFYCHLQMVLSNALEGDAVFLIRSYGAPNGTGRFSLAQ